MKKEKPEILPKQDFDKYVWKNSVDPNLTEISHRSLVPDKWVRFDDIKNGDYSDSIIKPVNKYVEQIGIPPELVYIDGNTVRLRQGNFAEIYLLNETTGLYNIDRPHMRQYYVSSPLASPDSCFEGTYAFFMPWFLDAEIEAAVEQPLGVESPVFVYPQSVSFGKADLDQKYMNPAMVKFHFKKAGSHMTNDYLGKIRKNSPIFDVVFSASDIIIEKIKDFYVI